MSASEPLTFAKVLGNTKRMVRESYTVRATNPYPFRPPSAGRQRVRSRASLPGWERQDHERLV